MSQEEEERIVTLQVGERHFTTSRETLVSESGFFASLLSGNWGSARSDGSYFIDADPEIFEHILRYLRRGILPIFFDRVKGHDHNMYLSVLEEARYFQLDRLIEWLENRSYVNAVQVTHSLHQYDEGDYDETIEKSSSWDMKFHVGWATKKVYICPREILAHRGQPLRCGRKCRSMRGDEPEKYEDEIFSNAVAVSTHVSFKNELRVEGR